VSICPIGKRETEVQAVVNKNSFENITSLVGEISFIYFSRINMSESNKINQDNSQGTIRENL
jgi:hypothetical protein